MRSNVARGRQLGLVASLVIHRLGRLAEASAAVYASSSFPNAHYNIAVEKTHTGEPVSWSVALKLVREPSVQPFAELRRWLDLGSFDAREIRGRNAEVSREARL